MNAKSLISNAATAFLAQGIAVVISFFQGLIIPKMLGLEQYGYWQLFLFYATYVGLFHLGLPDGVYLLCGGQRRDEIDKASIGSQFVFGMLYQAIFCVILIVVALFFVPIQERAFVVLCTSVYMLTLNAATYLGYVFQAMNETKIFSYSAIVLRVSFFIPLAALLALRVHAFEPYVLAYVFSSVCQLVYCLWHARDFFHAGFIGWGAAATESWASVRVGFKLLVANLASILVLGIARFAIDRTWDISTFGKLSFALSMVNFFANFVTQASMVLFPALRQSEDEEVAKFYASARDFMMLVFPVAYLVYFPGIWLLGLWLPDYASSFGYLALLLPICVFDSRMEITCTTLFKVRREERLLLRINLVTCAASALGALAGVYLFHDPFFVIAFAVVAIVGRSVWSEYYLNGALASPAGGRSLAEMALTLVFLASAFLLPPALATVLYAAAYSLYLFVYRARLKTLATSLRRVAR